MFEYMFMYMCVMPSETRRAQSSWSQSYKMILCIRMWGLGHKLQSSAKVFNCWTVSLALAQDFNKVRQCYSWECQGHRMFAEQPTSSIVIASVWKASFEWPDTVYTFNLLPEPSLSRLPPHMTMWRVELMLKGKSIVSLASKQTDIDG